MPSIGAGGVFAAAIRGDFFYYRLNGDRFAADLSLLKTSSAHEN
jgi:hypothetical protein